MRCGCSLPIDKIRVLAVHSTDTAKPGVRQYLIDAQTIEQQPRHAQYMTVNDLRAALCSQLAGTTQELFVTWRDGRMRSKDLVHVERT